MVWGRPPRRSRAATSRFNQLQRRLRHKEEIMKRRIWLSALALLLFAAAAAAPQSNAYGAARSCEASSGLAAITTGTVSGITAGTGGATTDTSPATTGIRAMATARMDTAREAHQCSPGLADTPSQMGSTTTDTALRHSTDRRLTPPITARMDSECTTLTVTVGKRLAGGGCRSSQQPVPLPPHGPRSDCSTSARHVP